MLNMDSTNYQAFSGAVAFSGHGLYDSALITLEAMGEHLQDHPALRYQKALIYYKTGRYDDVCELVDEMDEDYQYNPLAWKLKGMALRENGEIEKAEAYINQALNEKGATAALMDEAGTIAWLQGNTEGAFIYWEVGITLDPAYADNYLNLAKLYLERGYPLASALYAEVFANMGSGTSRLNEAKQLLNTLYDSLISLQNGQLRIKPAYNRTAMGQLGPIYATLEGAARLTDSLAKDCPLAGQLFSLRRIFVKNWNNDTGHRPNPMFDYMLSALIEGHLEAYHYWLLYGEGDQRLTSWQAQNPGPWERFIDWKAMHPFRQNTAYFFSIFL